MSHKKAGNPVRVNRGISGFINSHFFVFADLLAAQFQYLLRTCAGFSFKAVVNVDSTRKQRSVACEAPCPLLKKNNIRISRKRGKDYI